MIRLQNFYSETFLIIYSLKWWCEKEEMKKSESLIETIN